MTYQTTNEDHLRVFNNRTELHLNEGVCIEFIEGRRSQSAKARYDKIVEELKKGYLKTNIELCKHNPERTMIESLNLKQHKIIDDLVSSVTSEYGRAILGLSFLQLTIKAITPKQSIRLHKSDQWIEGLSMRSLDKNYITPILREYNLIKLNADGFMMTRTLAENYPYSRFYKASIRGAREAWIDLVEELEHPTNSMNSLAGLHLMINKLLNNVDLFTSLTDKAKDLQLDFLKKKDPSIEYSIQLIKEHWVESTYSARIMEISMHAFFQALGESDLLEYDLKPLSQMRSANKKHGNIVYIELLNHYQIIESWDAKYGKSYLYDELCELEDKLSSHDAIKIAGFVTSGSPDMYTYIKTKIADVSQLFGVHIEILSFEQWIYHILESLSIDRNDSSQMNIISKLWLNAYTETISLKRTDIAPIDEPCQQWLEDWISILKKCI